MKGRTLGLALLTLVVIVVAWKVSEDKAPQTEVSRSQLYPGLLDRLNEVERVRLRSGDDASVLVRDGERWLMANKDAFPADGAAVRRTVLQVASLRVVEPKTANPERYARLGVQDADAEDADSTLVELLGEDDAALARLLVGHASDNTSAPRHYVRRAGEEQSWLVEGELDVPADPVPWLDAGIVDIDTARVAEVRIERDGATPVVIRKREADDNFFALMNVPDGFEAKSKATVSSGGALLLDLRFNDVGGADAVAGATPLRTVTVRTFDGLLATLQDYELDERTVTAFEFATVEPETTGDATDATGASQTPDTTGEDMTETDAGNEAADDAAQDPADGETVTQRAARLNARTNGWVYVLPDYKRRMIERDFDSLVQPVEETTAGEDE